MGAPIYASALDIEPEKFDVKQIGAWGNWTHSGNFRALHPPGAEFDARLCAAFWEIIEAQTVETSTVYAGASVLAGGGVAVSMLGARAHDLMELVRRLRAAARVAARVAASLSPQ